MKVCKHCGEQIQFIRMASSARWSCSKPGGNKCDHEPMKGSE